MKHTNKNIEIIEKNLWAVKYSLIPLIPEIHYVPVSSTQGHQEPGRMTDDGIMLLNKEYEGYPMFKDLYRNIMKKTNRQLKKDVLAGKKRKNLNQLEAIIYPMAEVELERRERVRKRR